MKSVTIENVKARIAELEMIASHGELSLRGEFELACLRQLVAAMDSKPVAWMSKGGTVLNGMRQSAHDFAHYNIPLYRHAQPALVVPEKILADLEYEANHITAWHHMDEHSCKVNRRDLLTLVNACRAAMLQAGNEPPATDNTAQTDTLERFYAWCVRESASPGDWKHLAWMAVDRYREITAPEPDQPENDNTAQQFEALATSTKCKRCDGEGWVADEMGITQCGCGATTSAGKVKS